MPNSQKPLSGVTVLDFTRVLAGPYATALMADLGADVIKVESAGGDDYRHVGPFRGGESALFQVMNRGKRSIALDLKNPKDISVVHRLIGAADVLVENFRPGVMDKLGLGRDSVAAINPQLIYASISGFGQTGPNQTRPAYDIIVQAMSGIMAQTGEAAGSPTMIGEAMGDVAGGLFAAWGIMVALYEREKRGKARSVDLALFDALLAMMPTAGARVLVADDDPLRTGNRHALSAPFGVYPAKDGHFAIAVLNDRLFASFCETIGRPDLATDTRFSGDESRRAHEPVLAAAISAWAGGLCAADAVAALSAAGIPAALLHTAREAWLSDQAAARGLFSEVRHPDLGALQLPEQPVHFSGTARGSRQPAPQLDQHGAEIRAQMRDEQ